MTNKCCYCSGSMRITKLTCEDCGLAHEGEFLTSRVSRLESDELKFAELFLLSSGSLKEMARVLELSYPTIRNRLDTLIKKLEEEKVKDEKKKQQLLSDIEKGKIAPTKGMRLIDAL